MNNLLIKSVSLFLAAGLIFLTACQEETDVAPAEPLSENEAKAKALAENKEEIISAIKNFSIEGPIGGDNLRLANGGFSFSDPSTGYQFTDDDGVYYSPYYEGIRVSGAGFTSSDGAGVLTAGQYGYGLDYVFCISADAEDNLFAGIDGLSDFEGFSMLVGIGGNLDVEDAVDETDQDSEDLFEGFGIDHVLLMFIYDDNADGAYEVIDFNLDGGEPEEDDISFGAILDLRNSALFFSSEGTLSASGGSIGFQGKMLEIDFSFFENQDSEDDMDFGSYDEVNAFGSLNCN